MKHHSKTGKVKDRHTATPFIHHEQTHYHSLNTDSSLVRMHHGGNYNQKAKQKSMIDAKGQAKGSLIF